MSINDSVKPLHSLHVVKEGNLRDPGLLSDVARPLPIPNRVVKRISADNNAPARVCEDRSRPGFFVATEAYNRDVARLDQQYEPFLRLHNGEMSPEEVRKNLPGNGSSALKYFPDEDLIKYARHVAEAEERLAQAETSVEALRILLIEGKITPEAFHELTHIEPIFSKKPGRPE